MKIITTRKKCPNKDCNGELIYTNVSYANSRGTYHDNKCTVCNTVYNLSSAYPTQHTEYTKKELEERWEK